MTRVIIKNSCFSIGHSNHSQEDFLALLIKHQVTHLIDVRSQPFSKYVPHFNKEMIEKFILQHGKGIKYVYMGKSLGGRTDNPNCLFEDGVVNYSQLEATPTFNDGLQEILKLIHAGGRIALMCVEKDPLDCHRFVLVARALKKNGVDVLHILSDGSLMRMDELEQKIQVKYKDQITPTLFDPPRSAEDMLAMAYEFRNKDIAYKMNNEEQPL